MKNSSKIQANSFVETIAHDNVKIDAKKWTIESSGLIAWVVVIGIIGIGLLYVYGKFFHVKVKQGITNVRKRRKTKKKQKN